MFECGVDCAECKCCVDWKEILLEGRKEPGAFGCDVNECQKCGKCLTGD